MIVSFKHRGLKRLYEDGDGSKIAPDMLPKVRTILARLDIAERIEDLDVIGFRLHPLKGDMLGYWSVVVRSNWRIVFRLDHGDVYDVELIDYH